LTNDSPRNTHVLLTAIENAAECHEKGSRGTDFLAAQDTTKNEQAFPQTPASATFSQAILSQAAGRQLSHLVARPVVRPATIPPAVNKAQPSPMTTPHRWRAAAAAAEKTAPFGRERSPGVVWPLCFDWCNILP
jgi:hypothetical protein